MGVSKIREYKPYKGVPIARDYSVHGEQVFIGNGQGCGTIWFWDVKDARRFIDFYEDELKRSRDFRIIPSELCKDCKCHYSYGTPEWKKAKREFNCREYKEELKRKAGIKVRIYLSDGIHNYTRLIKVRKPQTCILCNKTIQKGEEAIVHQWQDGGFYVRDYYCLNCAEPVNTSQ